jgi:hypothetical protein
VGGRGDRIGASVTPPDARRRRTRDGQAVAPRTAMHLRIAPSLSLSLLLLTAACDRDAADPAHERDSIGDGSEPGDRTGSGDPGPADGSTDDGDDNGCVSRLADLGEARRDVLGLAGDDAAGYVAYRTTAADGTERVAVAAFGADDGAITELGDAAIDTTAGVSIAAGARTVYVAGLDRLVSFAKDGSGTTDLTSALLPGTMVAVPRLAANGGAGLDEPVLVVGVKRQRGEAFDASVLRLHEADGGVDLVAQVVSYDAALPQPAVLRAGGTYFAMGRDVFREGDGPDGELMGSAPADVVGMTMGLHHDGAYIYLTTGDELGRLRTDGIPYDSIGPCDYGYREPADTCSAPVSIGRNVYWIQGGDVVVYLGDDYAPAILGAPLTDDATFVAAGDPVFTTAVYAIAGGVLYAPSWNLWECADE